MLDLMLGHGTNAFSCGEIGYWFRRIALRHSVVPCVCGSNDCPVWRQLLDVPEERFHEHVLDRLQVGAVIDSTKRLSWVWDVNRWAKQGGFRSANVVIWKSPLAFAHSCWKRQKDVVSNLRRYDRYFRHLRDTRLPVVAVSYDRLVTDPAGQLSQLGKLLDIPYFPGKERFWEHPHHLAFGNEGTRLTLRDLAPSIRAPQGYTDEFLNYFQQIEQSPRLPDLTGALTWLQDRDISRNPAIDWTSWNTPDISPWWYYRQLMPVRVRRWFNWYR